MLLANEFPFIEGFIDVVVLRHMSLNAPVHGDAIQCHHIGNHWVVLTSMGESHVTVYDSLTPALPHALRCQLANLYRRFAAGIHGRTNVHVRCTQRQIGGSDCGLFAIANAVPLANGQDPGRIRFHQEQMRPHLFPDNIHRLGQRMASCWQGWQQFLLGSTCRPNGGPTTLYHATI